jgi:hypothetical protein
MDANERGDINTDAGRLMRRDPPGGKRKCTTVGAAWIKNTIYDYLCTNVQINKQIIYKWLNINDLLCK